MTAVRHVGTPRHRAPGVRRFPVHFAPERLEGRALLAVFTVTTTADAGPGSLRQAILDANAAAGADEVRFAIPGSPGAARTIRPTSPLPAAGAADNPLVIDATSQSGYSGLPLVELDGSGAGAMADGLTLGADCAVRGLAINRFDRHGLVVAGDRARVEACYVGLTAAGDAAAGNGVAGVRVLAREAVVGGSSPSQRNVISGNHGDGVWVLPSGAPATIAGNYIGTDARGVSALGNARNGVFVDGGGAVIGGANPELRDGNLISGNGASGIELGIGSGAIIQGNRIGTDAFGARAIPNGWSALAERRNGISASTSLQLGGPTAGARNLISGNFGAGVAINEAGQSVIQGNFIGTDVTGNAPIGNGGDGIYAEGMRPVFSTGGIFGNLIAGNSGNGISLSGGITTIGGNYIGTNSAGRAPVPNSGNGIRLDGPMSATIGKADATSSAPAVIDPAGTTRNIISANRGHGVHGVGASGDVFNNVIGLDATGTVALGNGGHGLFYEGGTLGIGSDREGGGNVISANQGNGITLVGAGTSHARGVYGNRIGTNAAGNASDPSLGNRGHGILISSRNIPIGHPDRARTGNTIAFNGGAGVRVENSSSADSTSLTRVPLSRNSIFSNGRLGIDLVAPGDGFSGVTPNDAGDVDVGPNLLLNFPVITMVNPGAENTTVTFTLRGAAGTYRVEFFSSRTPDPSGFGEGATYLDAVTVTQTGTSLTRAVTLPAVPLGEFITATATQESNTSEFSEAFRVGASSIVNRRVFYNNSAADTYDPAPGALDDAALAMDKSAHTGVAKAVVANLTSYPKGINGVFVDIGRLPAGAALTPDDFAVRRSGAGGGWTAGPPPAQVSVRRGAGANGSDRVTLVWPDADDPTVPPAERAVANGWLEVTVKANARTGLDRDDVFSFGNLVGDNFLNVTTTATTTRVDLRDLISTRLLVRRIDFAWHDYNRDGVINVRDVLVTRRNLGRSLTLVPGTAQATVRNDALIPRIPLRTHGSPQRRTSESYGVQALLAGGGSPTVGG
jgi:hypothetical protein